MLGADVDTPTRVTCGDAVGSSASCALSRPPRLRSDIAAMERFFPDDMIVTNPFNQVIDKPKVIERVKANIIKYTSMTKDVEYVGLFGDVVVTMGLETAKVTPDAARNDAGKMTYRRFTEVWTFRGGSWKKIVRHGNHFEPNP